MSHATKPELKVIQGGLRSETFWDDVRIVAAPQYAQPFRIDAIAAEEDTFLVLSAEKTVRMPSEHIIRIMTRLIETLPVAPGNVVVKNGQPMRLLAVIHDLDRVPSWREDWISQALDRIFIETMTRNFHSVALPLLGTVYGAFDIQRFINLLKHALKRISQGNLKRLWLIVPKGTSRRVIQMFKSES